MFSITSACPGGRGCTAGVPTGSTTGWTAAPGCVASVVWSRTIESTGSAISAPVAKVMLTIRLEYTGRSCRMDADGNAHAFRVVD